MLIFKVNKLSKERRENAEKVEASDISIESLVTPYCLGHFDLVQSLPTIHSSLEQNVWKCFFLRALRSKDVPG